VSGKGVMHTEFFGEKFGMPGLCYKRCLRYSARTGHIELAVWR